MQFRNTSLGIIQGAEATEDVAKREAFITSGRLEVDGVKLDLSVPRKIE